MARSGHYTGRPWSRTIRFTELDGSRIAYATVGEGPLLLFGGRWVTHLEEEWDDPRTRAFFEDLAATHRVVRYDRIGAGLSERTLPGPATMELDSADARRGARRGWRRARDRLRVLLRRPREREYATAEPGSRRKIVFFGGYAARDDIPEVTRRSLVDFVRTNWPLAAQMLAGLITPHGSGDEIAALSRYQRHSADAEVAAAFLELDLASDARPILPRVTAPALVLHRRGDRTVPIGRGRELASLLPNAASSRSAGTRTSRTWTTSASSSARSPGSSTKPPGRDERPLAPDPARDRGAPPRRGGPLEPRDRVLARPQRAHRPPAHGEHPPQAHAVDAGGRGRARDARRPDLARDVDQDLADRAGLDGRVRRRRAGEREAVERQARLLADGQGSVRDGGGDVRDRVVLCLRGDGVDEHELVADVAGVERAELETDVEPALGGVGRDRSVRGEDVASSPAFAAGATSTTMSTPSGDQPRISSAASSLR